MAPDAGGGDRVVHPLSVLDPMVPSGVLARCEPPVIAAEVCEEAEVRIRLVGIGDHGAVVLVVGHSVVVRVVVADVPDTVVVSVRLVLVGQAWAVVADVRRAVVVRVELLRIGVERAEVAGVEDAVLVPVSVHLAQVAQVVPVAVRLVRVEHHRAHVDVVGDEVAVCIQVARVALAVVVHVLLERVEVVQAVVLQRPHEIVAVGVGIADVA